MLTVLLSAHAEKIKDKKEIKASVWAKHWLVGKYQRWYLQPQGCSVVFEEENKPTCLVVAAGAETKESCLCFAVFAGCSVWSPEAAESLR